MKKSYEDHILNCEFDEPLFTFEEYSSRADDSQFFKFKCRKCGNTFESPHHDGYHRKCPICYPKLEGVSAEEIELRETVRSLVPDEKMIVGSRLVIPPRELDIYLPGKKFAIEFDGLFWHSDANDIITKAYHAGKTEACDEKGIRLIHVFEDEWIEKRCIVESRLKNLLGVYDKTVFARKCEVKDVTSREAELFQNSSHIQGSVRAKVRLGLYFENELVALMTFGKSRGSLNDPSRYILLSERGGDSPETAVAHQCYHAMEEPDEWEDDIAHKRHSGRGNYLCVDGHVETLTFKETIGDGEEENNRHFVVEWVGSHYIGGHGH